MIDQDTMEKYIKAGEIVNATLKEAKRIVKPGVKIIDICEKLENLIRGFGGKPAFPVNVSVNEIAAHYSSPIGDTSTIPNDGLVKVDVGAHIDGYITDAAITIPLSRKYEKMAYTALKALIEAQKNFTAGKKLGKIGLIIEKTVKQEGFNPIRNLTGHLITRYNLHAGKIVPNVKTVLTFKINLGEVYAIEPFVTNGYGEVIEWIDGYIYRIRNIKKAKTRIEKKIVEEIYSRYRTLPFSERWIKDIIDPDKVRKVLADLVKKRIIEKYNVFIEKTGGYVAQFENTVIVTEKGAYVVTRVEEIA
ncbi:MAG: type II methionyl aminopeptidase [Thermoprotei archaeon]|nr:MAG: type II methionyl aminopeptidase [Thermoprotei archaeon]